MSGKKFCFSLPLFFVLVFSGCGSSFHQALKPSNQDLSEIKTVAVAPFANLSPSENADQIITELITQSLLERGRYSVIENQAVLKVIPSETGSSRLLDRNQAQKIGQSLQADAVIYGTVSEYWYQEEKKYHPYPERNPAVAFHARLLDVESGAVIGAVSISRAGGGGGLFRESAKQLYRTARQTSREAVAKLLP